MKKFFKGLLVILLIVAAGFGYWNHRSNKPLVLNTSVNFVDLLNHIGYDTDYPGESKQNADGTSTIKYEVVEERVFKIPFKPGYPKKVKVFKFYTLTFHFNADGYLVGWEAKENPQSPLLGIKRK